MGEKSYQLKDKEAGFTDPESGLSVTRNQVVRIDTSKGAGKATMRAIKAGGLIEVNLKSKAAEKPDPKDAGAKDKEKAR